MRDVDQIIKRVASAWPDVEVRQLHVSHPGADDDGLWFFTRGRFEAQIESSTGMCPFLIEADESSFRFTAHSVEETLATLATLLHVETPLAG